MSSESKIMGTGLVDWWSLAHFIGGVVYRLVIFPDDWLLSFVTSVFMHLLGELVEKTVHPVTGSKEDGINHHTDMAFFIAGWLVGCFINPYLVSYRSPLWKSPRMWLLVIAMLFTIKEFLREIIVADPNSPASKLLY